MGKFKTRIAKQEFQTRIANSLLREKKAIVGRPKSNVTLQHSEKRKSATASTPAD